MNIEIKLSKRRISYQKAMNFLDKRVQEIKENKKREKERDEKASKSKK